MAEIVWLEGVFFLPVSCSFCLRTAVAFAAPCLPSFRIPWLQRVWVHIGLDLYFATLENPASVSEACTGEEFWDYV
jgi:hypothetical protein